jgi:hypothetical protein
MRSVGYLTAVLCLAAMARHPVASGADGATSKEGPRVYADLAARLECARLLREGDERATWGNQVLSAAEDDTNAELTEGEKLILRMRALAYSGRETEATELAGSLMGRLKQGELLTADTINAVLAGQALLSALHVETPMAVDEVGAAVIGSLSRDQVWLVARRAMWLDEIDLVTELCEKMEGRVDESERFSWRLLAAQATVCLVRHRATRNEEVKQEAISRLQHAAEAAQTPMDRLSVTVAFTRLSSYVRPDVSSGLASLIRTWQSTGETRITLPDNESIQWRSKLAARIKQALASTERGKAMTPEGLDQLAEEAAGLFVGSLPFDPTEEQWQGYGEAVAYFWKHISPCVEAANLSATWQWYVLQSIMTPRPNAVDRAVLQEQVRLRAALVDHLLIDVLGQDVMETYGGLPRGRKLVRWCQQWESNAMCPYFKVPIQKYELEGEVDLLVTQLRKIASRAAASDAEERDDGILEQYGTAMWQTIFNRMTVQDRPGNRIGVFGMRVRMVRGSFQGDGVYVFQVVRAQ